MDAALARLPSLSPQGVSNVAHALASLHITDCRFFDRLASLPGLNLAAYDVQVRFCCFPCHMIKISREL